MFERCTQAQTFIHLCVRILSAWCESQGRLLAPMISVGGPAQNVLM